jgi:cysteine synthase A
MSNRSDSISTDLLGEIGNTPLVKIDDIFGKPGVNIFAKCEFLNPTGSHKDRMYYYMINKLEEEGKIRPEQRLVDFSSGNGGTALAYVGLNKGYDVTVVRPEGLSSVKATQIEALGAELVLTPSKEGVEGARRRAFDLVEEYSDTYMMHQTASELNIKSFIRCGREIVNQMRKNDHYIDAFVCSIGTGGTLTGCSKALKEDYPDVLIVGGEVKGAEVNLAKVKNQDITISPHHIEGLSPGMAFKNTNLELIDRIETCSEVEAWKHLFELEKRGFLVGPSSGHSISIAEKVAPKLPSEANIVTIFWDAGWKYYSEREQWLQDAGVNSETMGNI